MKSVELIIKSNVKINHDTYLMTLEGDLSSIKNPGEFVEIKLDNYYLRRPISVCEFSSNELKLLYKVLGHGTKDMTSYEEGKKVDNSKYNDSIRVSLYNYDISIYFDNSSNLENELIELNKEKEALIKSIERREKLLSNENYVNKAPEAVVAKDRESLEKEKERLDFINKELETLNNKNYCFLLDNNKNVLYNL